MQVWSAVRRPSCCQGDTNTVIPTHSSPSTSPPLPPPPPKRSARPNENETEAAGGAAGRLKRLHWRVLRPAPGTCTVWQALPPFELSAADTDELRTLFRTVTGKRSALGDVGGDDAKKRRTGTGGVKSVLDTKRSNAVSFALAKLPDAEELVRAMYEADS